MLPTIEIKTILYMLAIEEEGGFQKAADALYISQPALSQYIRRVEEDLSFPLYEREKGRCTPTKAGAILLEQGRKLMRCYGLMLEDMKAAAHVRDIHIGWPTGYSIRYFTELVSTMHERYMIQVHVTEDSVERLTSMLVQNKLDMCFLPVLYYHPELTYTVVRHEEFYLGVPKDHIANEICKGNAKDGYVDLSCLRDIPFVLTDARAYTEFFDSLFQDYSWKPYIAFSCKDWDRGFQIASQGKCIGIFPYWYADEDQDKIVFYKIKSNHPNYRTFACATRKDVTLCEDGMRIADYMREIAGDEFAGEVVDQTLLQKFRG